MTKIVLRILESHKELLAVEELQRWIWSGSEIEIVPLHMLLAAVHNGGLAIGAFEIEESQFIDQTQAFEDSVGSDDSSETTDGLLIGFTFGFPGIYQTADGPRIKHHSHMLGVLPAYRDRGVGFLLKRAQWQMVRHQGLDRITWTYDPLLSRNAHLNITRLGAVCNTYIPNYYGEMRDDMNIGLPSDRFQVDWWVNSRRVIHRLSKKPRRKLDLAHFLAAGIQIINPSKAGKYGLPVPQEKPIPEQILETLQQSDHPMLLVEIPADFLDLKAKDAGLALSWRYHTRALMEGCFALGWLVTDFIHLPGTYPRSFYVLSHGESTL